MEHSLRLVALIDMTAEQTEYALARALVEIVGGADVVDMLIGHYDQQVPVSVLAQKHYMTPQGIRQAMARAKVKLRRVGAMPERWETTTPTPTPTPLGPPKG